jgi:hypothetical protein
MSIQLRSLIYNTVWYDRARRIKQKGDLLMWIARGKPAPAPSLKKQKLVASYAGEFSLKTLIETGTYLGDMVYASRGVFDKIFSIELDDSLYARAVRRFSGFSHITIFHGDSGTLLPGLLDTIQGPCLFWLDAHYSGGITAKGVSETPIMQEMQLILGRGSVDDVILIDDARAFGSGGYPEVESVRELLSQRRPGWSLNVADDVIRIHKMK